MASGEPVPEHVDEAFDLTFVPAPGSTEPEEEVELDSGDLDTIFHDGAAIDLGREIADTLALSIDPYPRSAQADAAPQISGTFELAGRTYLTLAFPRLAGGQSGLAYAVRESIDLRSWEIVTLGTNTTATVSHGDGTETITVRGNLPIAGPDAVPRAFLQLLVTPASAP